MNTVINLANEIWMLINEMSPYLLLGFLLAGLMHAFIPQTLYARYLGKNDLRSVLYAALFGIPIPLCSCGVIPTAMGLRRQGASRGATTSFLIATPQTGIDSITATYSLLGLPFAIVRPLVALCTSVFGGLLVNTFVGGNCSESNTQHAEACHTSEHHTLWSRLLDALRYGFCEMMADIGKWLVIGLIIAGIITTLVPDEWFAIFRDNSLASILLVLCISIPMYVCATGSIPIAVALMMKGLTPGSALVLLMAGPACNVASVLVIRKVMGNKTLLLYLSAIITGAVIFGLGIDYFLPREWFTEHLQVVESCCADGHAGWFNTLCSVALILMLAVTLLPFGHHHHHDHEECEAQNSDMAETTENSANNTGTIKLSVEGMNCSHCANSVEQALNSLPGVEHATVSLKDKCAVVRGTASAEELTKCIESLGFSVTGSK